MLRRRQFLSGQDIEGSGLPDVWWFRTDGRKMAARDWDEGTPVVGMFLNGEEITTPGERGERIVDDSFLILFNAHHEDVTFTLPNRRFGQRWTGEVTTVGRGDGSLDLEVEALDEVEVMSRSLMVLRRIA